MYNHLKTTADRRASSSSRIARVSTLIPEIGEREMEAELVEADIVLPMHLSFKKTQSYEKYPKGQSRGRWKHLKQILQAENFQDYPPQEPNCKSDFAIPS